MRDETIEFKRLSARIRAEINTDGYAQLIRQTKHEENLTRHRCRICVVLDWLSVCLSSALHEFASCESNRLIPAHCGYPSRFFWNDYFNEDPSEKIVNLNVRGYERERKLRRNVLRKSIVYHGTGVELNIRITIKYSEIKTGETRVII